MKRLFLLASLVFVCAGCLGLPSKTTIDPVTGVITELTLEQQILALETEAATLNATIASLQATSAILPAPWNLIGLGSLAALAAALEAQKQKLRAELAARDAAPKIPSA